MKKLFLIFIMTLAIIPIVKGQETATSGKKVLSSLIEKTSSINFPKFVIYKNETRHATTGFFARPEIFIKTRGAVTDSIYTIHLRWKGSLSSAIVDLNYTKPQILEVCSAIEELESIDMTDASVGTSYQYVSPKKFLLKREKAKKGVRYYLFIAGNGHESYLGFKQVYGIFKPLKDYLETGIVPDEDTVNNKANTTYEDKRLGRSAAKIANERMDAAGKIMNRKIAPK